MVLKLIANPREDFMNTQRILARYRNADLHDRMALFLSYRDLRGEFQAIDAEDAACTESLCSPKTGTWFSCGLCSFISHLAGHSKENA